MPIYFNIAEARDYLLKNKVVFTLRERRRRHLGKLQIRCGSYRQFMLLGYGRVSYVKSINYDSELSAYLNQSGFDSVKDWRSKAGVSEHLYKVELI